MYINAQKYVHVTYNNRPEFLPAAVFLWSHTGAPMVVAQTGADLDLENPVKQVTSLAVASWSSPLFGHADLILAISHSMHPLEAGAMVRTNVREEAG